MSRFLLGSFAETLVLHSPVPTLVVGRGSRCSLEHIVFATDLGDHSRGLFDRAVSLSKQLGARLSIFHALPNLVEPVFQSGMFLLGGSWIPMQRYFSEDAQERRERIDDWVEYARGLGVDAVSVVDDSGESVSDALLAYAERERAGLISLAAQSGPLVSSLVGSVPRQVVRRAHCPVWILHPTQERGQGERRTAA